MVLRGQWNTPRTRADGIELVDEDGRGKFSMIRERTAATKVPALLCIGETMVLLTPDEGSLEQNRHVGIHVGGAESNVAAGLAHLGHDVEWFSKVGNDPFGRIICEFLRARGVSLENVAVDRARPTGIYFKDRDDEDSHVYYYRSGSAASALGPADLPHLRLESRTLCHVSGITAALSASANDLMQRLVIDRNPGDGLVSFDVNYRPALWSQADAAPRLLELARGADIVVVGRDEAQTLWGTPRAEDVREILPDAVHLVVKDAAIGATHFAEGLATFQSALKTDVVEPVGAGDAFAAGFLSGLVRKFDIPRSLRLGHLMAGLTLQHVSDLPSMPAAEDILAVSAVEDEGWANIRLGPSHLNNLHLLLLKGTSHDD